jgi:3-dehydroquinate synthase
MQKITVGLGDRSYDIVIEAGCLPRVGAFVRGVCGPKTRAAGVVTCDTVGGLFLDEVSHSLAANGFEVTPVILPDGEESKRVATWELILTHLIEARFERSSVIVALGGGVVGDIAGFAAATLFRGVPFIQVPTTIVAQVDSSIGGKTAVNHPLGKNLIGSFHQPRGVWIDTRALGSLPGREIASGMGEAIKHAATRDEKFFAFLEEHLESIMNMTASDGIMEEFIAWNCRIKAAVVEADERERGLRAILNYGHTVGHAIEKATGYGRFSHGEAVMLGMIAAGEISRLRGLLTEDDLLRQNALLVRAGAGGKGRDIDPAAVLEAMRRDKKVSEGWIRFILLSRIGAAEIYSGIAEEEILGGIEFMRGFQ